MVIFVVHHSKWNKYHIKRMLNTDMTIRTFILKTLYTGSVPGSV